MTVVHGDCVEHLKTLDADSVDAVVTDPPYGLVFMGKGWDDMGHGSSQQAWHYRWAVEVLRVLKPGGHLVAFGGTRTYHRLVSGVEDAGFEVRDQLQWLYGSGFPKSLNVSKAIDKVAPRIVMLNKFASYYEERRKAKHMSHVAVCELGGFYGNVNQGGSSRNWGMGSGVPTKDQWKILKPMLELSDKWEPLIDRVEAEREVVGVRERTLPTTPGFASELYGADGMNRVVDVTAPATADAVQWDGWGTALKPGHESIVLARKPLVGTVAENVLEWGTGGLNIDATRIGIIGEAGVWGATQNKEPGDGLTMGGGWAHRPTEQHPMGRWPANVVLDEAVGAMLDAQSGQTRDAVVVRENIKPNYAASSYEFPPVGGPNVGYGGGGGASRFFYCPKASTLEREYGLNGDTPRNNLHPTVKPVDLMRWLVRLVTPPGGLVLDPFTGSGTTGVACKAEGFRFLGIEQDEGFVELARERIESWVEGLPVPVVVSEDQLVFEMEETKQ